MRKITIIISLFVVMTGDFSCEPPEIVAGFEDMEQMTIYDYIVENEADYSSFMRILQKGGIDKTMSAYNPDGLDYTLFLPNNNAIDEFIQESDQFSSLDDLLNDSEYVSALSRYHVVNMGINSDDFPFGALPEYTLSGDLLTVSFVVETDTAYFKINNQAPVIINNIELSNGYIHVISRTLIPITYTTYNWLEQHPGYSIFKSVVEETGLDKTLDLNTKEDTSGLRPITLLIEHDSVFNKRKIYSLNDLISLISPDNADYTNPTNPLYNFAAYHILTGIMFLVDFADKSSNYTTYSEVPLNINGLGLDIIINKGKEVFDTIIYLSDTTIIDYIGINYDASNVLTQSGSIHFIDQVLQQQKPSRATQTFEFYEESLLNEYRQEPGTYLIEDTSLLNVIKWSGTELAFVEETDPEESSAWGGDYLYMEGDFIISYTIPKIVQGKYTVFLGAEALNTQNALVEIEIDGKNIGGLINLATGGTTDSPFARIELGTINFLKYSNHTVKVSSLIPGKFSWDYIGFEPSVN